MVFLVSGNVIALTLMIPLNSAIFASPESSVCLSCLVGFYGWGWLIVGCLLVASYWLGGDTMAVRVAKTLSVMGLVSFLHLVQVTSVSASWRTAYVILCIVAFAPAVVWFLRAGKKTVILVHQFLVILLLYEMLNVSQVVLQAREWEAVVASNTESRRASVQSGDGRVTLDGDGPHVFWLLFDEFSLVNALRNGSLDEDIVPNLTEFARTSTWYPHARTLYSVTASAVPALLLGKKDVKNFGQHFVADFDGRNYFSSLAQRMDVFVAGDYLPYCSAFQEVVTGCRIFQGSEFANYDQMVKHVWSRAVPGVLRYTWGGIAFHRLFVRLMGVSEHPITHALDVGQSFNRPTLTYVHERLPHFPYYNTGNGEISGNTEGDRPTMELNPDEIESLQKFYKEQVTYTDALFGEFVARLKARELYDRSFIVVMSDHGISFDPQNPGRDTIEHEQVYRIPFLIRSPGQSRGEVNPSPVYTDEFFEILLERMARETRHASLSHAELS